MNKLKSSVWMVCGLLAAFAARPALAGDMIADAAGKTGAFTTKLKSSCAESEREAIAKRMTQTGYAKHDLTNTPYDIYVPKEPGKDGKYGLIVTQNYREIGKPPEAWLDVLEKYHLIWMGPQGITDGSPALMRVGYTLDAVYNAENTWPLDMTRIYLFNCSKDHPAAELGLYYPEVFTATINCSQFQWFHGIKSVKMKGFSWDFPPMHKPEKEITDLAKTRKFVLIDRSEDKVTDLDTDVATEGYVKDGYKNAKILSTKTDIATKYMAMKPDWFETSIMYIEGIGGATSKPGSTDAAAAITPSVMLTAAQAEVAAAPAFEATKAPMPAAGAAPAAANGKPAAATKPAAPVVVVPQVSEADVAEEKATKALNLARTYWAAGKNDIAKTRLQQILKQYPKTTAAKDAKTLLDQITAMP